MDNKVNSEHKLGKDQELEEPGQQQLKSLGVIISVLGPTNSTLVQKTMAGLQKQDSMERLSCAKPIPAKIMPAHYQILQHDSPLQGPSKMQEIRPFTPQ